MVVAHNKRRPLRLIKLSRQRMKVNRRGQGFVVVGFFKHDLVGFYLTTIHNIVHPVTGGAALYFGFTTTVGTAHMFCLIKFGLKLK